jgi:hypothetical protein
MDEYLDGLHDLVHEGVKRLKIGQTGTIQCSKQYPEKEVQLYVVAYAMHKEKWFETKYDKAGDVVYAARVEVPNWEKPDVIDEEEER